MSEAEMLDLVDAIECITNIAPTGPGEALPCLLDYDIAVDTSTLPRWSSTCFRIVGNELHVCGSMPGLDACLAWSEGDAEYVSGTPPMAELMSLLTGAVDARPGAILGSMCLAFGIDHAGPIVMTGEGVRWCPSETLAGERLHGSTMRTAVGAIPSSMLVPSVDRDPRCHVDIDRRALRMHLRYEGMKRARTPSWTDDARKSAEAA